MAGSLPCFLSSARPIECSPYQPIYLKSILILSFHLRLGLQSGSFPQPPSPPKPRTNFSSPPHQPQDRTTQCSWFEHPDNTWWEQTTKPLTVQHHPLSLSRPSQAQASSSAPYPRTLSAYVPPSMWWTKFHTHKITVLYILIFISVDSEPEDRRFWTEWLQAYAESNLLNFLVNDKAGGANYIRPKKNGRWLQAVMWERLVTASYG